jgi:tripartite-type tricarboxylate transporter receptor subunit TctC
MTSTDASMLQRPLSGARCAAAALLAALWLSASLAAAAAQDAYPSRPVRIVVGFPAGAATDITTRIYADKLGAKLNQRFIVENMPGAATNLAAAHVARAAPDGYTLYLITNANSTNVHLYRNLNYRFPGDFAPIATTVSVPPILVASPQFKPSTVREVIAAAKDKPGEVTYGSAGELLVAMSGIRLTHVPYKGTPEAVADLITGRISLLFAALPVVLPHVRDGRLKAIGVSTAQRSGLAPSIPTFAESGLPDMNVMLWFGLAAPRGTPEPVVRALAAAVESIQKDDDTRQRLATAGADVLTLTGADLARFIDADIPKWAKAVEAAGMQKVD